MFKNKSKKSVALLAALALVVCIAVGGTLAYIFDISNIVNNVFDPAEVTTEVTETLTNNNTVKEDVAIKNTGNIDAWIRATVVVNWKAEDGSVYGKAEPVIGQDYALNLKQYAAEDEAKWILGSDGYYYWTKPVAPGASTGELIDSASLTGTAPAGYSLSIEILGSGIQSRPDAAVADAWKVVKVEDGTLIKQ